MALEPAHFEDRLMAVLLAEEVGHEDCPDLAGSILAEAFPRPGVLNWRIGAMAAAVAAMLVMGVVLWPEGQAGYPGLQVVGQVTVEGGGPVVRGSFIQAPAAPAELVLGGYGHVEMAAGTRLQVLGEAKHEAVALVEGKVTCQVDSGVGRFEVSTPFGTVQVKGTRFSVELTGENSKQIHTKEGEPAMIKQQMWVRVLSGVVVLSGLMGEPQELRAGDEQKVTGGTVTGTVIEKGKNVLVLRVGEGEKAVELFPRWIGDAKGGLDERMLKMFEQVSVGAVVKAKVTYDERLRAVDLRIMKLPEPVREREEAREPDLEARPKTREELEKRREAGERREGDKPRADGEAREGERPHPEGEREEPRRPLPPVERREGDRPLHPAQPEARREGAEKERPAPAGEADRVEARMHELKKAIELGRAKLRELSKAGRERDAEKIERQVHELEKELEALSRKLREMEAAHKAAPKRETDKKEGGAESEKARRIRELERELEELKRSEREKSAEKKSEFAPARRSF